MGVWTSATAQQKWMGHSHWLSFMSSSCNRDLGNLLIGYTSPGPIWSNISVKASLEDKWTLTLSILNWRLQIICSITSVEKDARFAYWPRCCSCITKYTSQLDCNLFRMNFPSSLISLLSFGKRQRICPARVSLACITRRDFKKQTFDVDWSLGCKVHSVRFLEIKARGNQTERYIVYTNIRA